MPDQKSMPSVNTRWLSSLAKVFADEPLALKPAEQLTVLVNEVGAVQLAYHCLERIRQIMVKVDTTLPITPRLYQVGLAPSQFPCYADADDMVLRKTPGLYPDPLFPVGEGEILQILPNQWRAFWISLPIPAECAPGVYDLALTIQTPEGDVIEEATTSIRIHGTRLPKPELIHTEWLHQDCLASYYGVPVHSEAHWDLLGKFVEDYVAHHMNMILTPLFTPPLDTKIGAERPTVQLVGVRKTEAGYGFDFTKLERWIDLCQEKGIEYFEMSHLATQWGAAHCPKIMAETGNGEERIFGWENDSTGDAYREFLQTFLPKLDAFLKNKGIADRCYFHISDEPYTEHLEVYSKVSSFIKSLLPGYPFIDALSKFEFYKTGAVSKPIPATNHIEPFLEDGVEGLWAYYCCSQYKQVANRFFYMPSVRSRILGFQLFKFEIEGFLHWGYNFYYSQFSIKQNLNPFYVTDADMGWPSGDPFLVYPGEDGPISSIRHEVMRETLQDLALFQTVAKQVGRDRVIATVESALGSTITFSEFPCDEKRYLAARQAVIELLG